MNVGEPRSSSREEPSEKSLKTGLEQNLPMLGATVAGHAEKPRAVEP
ncbi:MAG: hypothetical protein QW797_08300 [Thermoproteota archaeon]